MSQVTNNLHTLCTFLFDCRYDWLNSNIGIELDLIVYLRTSPAVAHERLVRRPTALCCDLCCTAMFRLSGAGRRRRGSPCSL